MLQKSLSAEAAEAQVCQAQRMEIVGQLTGGVVHDFNNILTVITGTIEILAESVADRPDLAAIAALIAEAAARGGNLTSRLLAFARGQRSPPREVDVNALLVDATRLLRPTLGDQIEVDAKPAADVSPAWVDPSLLMTAILNLAILARDAMPEGGKLTFETRDSADHVVIAASAFGYGISAGRRDLAFVDLCMAHGLIRQSDGQIDCIGAGHGTSVEIHLPRAAGVARLPANDSSNAQLARGDEAILVVEDDVLVRRYVVTQIQGLGYRTLAAADASEALAIIDEGERIDLLFTDVMMPGPINGRHLAIEALRRRPSLKVLYTSGCSESAMLDDGFLDAGVLLLAKPYRKADLAKMIRIALAN